MQEKNNILGYMTARFDNDGNIVIGTEADRYYCLLSQKELTAIYCWYVENRKK